MAGGPNRVLIIEDHDDSREAFRILLAGADYEIATAADGREGLAIAVAFEPDVVIVDLALPDLDGCEVARVLCASDGRRPYLIALTGMGAASDRARAAAAGFDTFLLKPCSTDRIEEAIAAGIERRHRLAQ